MANRGNESSVPSPDRNRDRSQTYGDDESIRGVGDSSDDEFEDTEDMDEDQDDEEDEGDGSF
jgi:hypothetical protein